METVIDNTTIKKYPAYKDSGVEWLGEIPSSWVILPGLSFIFENKDRNKGMVRNTVLSLSYGNIRVKGEDELTGLVPESFETYQFVNKGDLIFRPTDLQNDTVSLRSSISEFEGIITNAYLNLRFKSNADSKFYHYFFRAIDNNKVIYGLGSGLRQNISYLDFRRFQFPFPPLHEQTVIATFLDRKTALIDQAIDIKQKQIELLKERRQILIHKAVTRGLNPKVKMKDSGVEWIGEIPEGWEIKRLKHLIKAKTGYAFSSDQFSNEGIPLIRISDLNEDGIVRHEYSPKMPHRFELYLNEYGIKRNDLLFAMTGGTIGKMAVFTSDVPALLNQRVCLFRIENDLIRKLIYYWMQTTYWKNYIDLKSIGGAQPNISDVTVLNLKIALNNDLEELSAIISHMEILCSKIANAISLKEQEIEKLKEYKATLINSAVTGKLRVPSV
jgi:type I restriction enzyme S subunit